MLRATAPTFRPWSSSRLRPASDTQAVGNAQAIRDYLTGHGAIVEPGDMRWWQRQRGNYLHEGAIEDDPPRRHRLLHAIGTCLAAELDRYAAEPITR